MKSRLGSIVIALSLLLGYTVKARRLNSNGLTFPLAFSLAGKPI